MTQFLTIRKKRGPEQTDAEKRAARLDMMIYDHLPQRLREQIANMAFSWKSHLAACDLATLQRAAAGEAESVIVDAACIWALQREAHTLAVLAQQHQDLHGYPCRHVAAEATIMRSFGPPTGRHARRRQYFLGG